MFRNDDVVDGTEEREDGVKNFRRCLCAIALNTLANFLFQNSFSIAT